MKIKFLKKESICFNGVDNEVFNINDVVETERLNSVSPKLADYYISKGIAEIYQETLPLNKEIKEVAKEEEIKEDERFNKLFELCYQNKKELLDLFDKNNNEIEMLKTQIEEMKKNYEEKALNPVIENKAITQIDKNKVIFDEMQKDVPTQQEGTESKKKSKKRGRKSKVC